MACSIVTLGCSADFHRHVHALVTERAFGQIVLYHLVRAGRLPEDSRDALPSWQHSGSSAHSAQRVEGRP